MKTKTLQPWCNRRRQYRTPQLGQLIGPVKAKKVPVQAALRG